MWPLFTDRWGDFRERLGLNPCPLAEDSAVLAGHGGGEATLAGTSPPFSSCAVDPMNLPLVLYLFSSLVVDTSPFWPENARVCGYLYPSSARMMPRRRQTDEAKTSKSGKEAPIRSTDLPHQNLCVESGMAGDGLPVGVKVKTPDIAPCLPSGVEAFLSAREDRPLYVGFGSMWAMCPPGYRLASALQVVLLGARQAGTRCLVVLPARETASAGEGFFGGVDAKRGSHLKELDSATEFVLKEFTASTDDADVLVSNLGV